MLLALEKLVEKGVNLFNLEGKIILVTGGSRGIGAAIVKRLENLGAIVAHINKNTVDVVTHGKLQVFADVCNSEEMRKAIQQIENTLGPIYGVVVNAGITNDTLFSAMNLETWRNVLNVNLDGAFNTIQPIIPLLKSRGEGSIVLISSIVGERGNIGQANYAASKAALIGLSKSLARENARYGIRVNVVSPGFIATEMVESIPEKVKEQIISEIPFRRFGNVDEIAWAVSFLLSPTTASYITGEVLRVNGGQYT
jgi:acetoacetyl-CoA reductase